MATVPRRWRTSQTAIEVDVHRAGQMTSLIALMTRAPVQVPANVGEHYVAVIGQPISAKPRHTATDTSGIE